MMLVKRLHSYFFCRVLKQLKAAQTVLKTMYDHEKKQKGITQNSYNSDLVKKTIINNNGYTRTLLSDEIEKELKKLLDKKEIDDVTVTEFTKMFDPRQGIKINEHIINDQLDRYNNGLNQKGLFPLSFNSTITRFIMHNILYKKQIENSSKYLEKNMSGSAVHHVVGTPGLGKSWSFIGIKLLHDKRIPSLIKNGPLQDSIFHVNFKLFYFHALQSRTLIVKHLMDEVKKDFNQIPLFLKQFENAVFQTSESYENFQKFVRYLNHAYEQKKIVVRFIVDQVNVLYNISQKVSDFHVQHLSYISSITKPIIMVSSRNNAYKSIRNDPIKSCSGSTNQRFKKTVLDNEINPHERLLYSLQCALFQLEKSGKTRDEAIQIIELSKNQEMYFGTHKSIVEVVKILISMQKNQQIRQNIRGEEQKLIQKSSLEYIKYQKKSKQKKEQAKQKNSSFKNLDLENMMSNLTDYRKRLPSNLTLDSLHLQDILLYLRILANALAFSNKLTKQVDIQCSLKVKDLSGLNVLLTKNVTALYKHIVQTQQEDVTKNLAEVNFFYIAEILGTKLIFFSQTKKILSILKLWSTQLLGLDFLSLLKKKQSSLYKKLINDKGFLFENSLCYQIMCLKKQKKQNQIIKMSLGMQNTIQHFKIRNIYENELPSIENPTILKQQIQKIINKKREQGSYIKAGPANPFFDFLLWEKKQKSMKIVFVDATVSQEKEQIEEKKSIFKDGIIGNNEEDYLMGIKFIVEFLAENSDQVEIFFFVLIPLLKTKQLGGEQRFTDDQIKCVKDSISKKIKNVILSYGYIEKSSQNVHSFQVYVNNKPVNFYKNLELTFNPEIIENFVSSNINRQKRIYGRRNYKKRRHLQASNRK